MIKGVGIDLVEVTRIARAMENERFIERIFTPAEQALLAERGHDPVRAAGMFAAKEAVAKALGTGFGPVGWQEIEVLREENGAPFAVLSGAAKALAGGDRVHVSISSERQMAAAVAVIETGDEDEIRG